MRFKSLRMTIDFYKYLFFLKKYEGISMFINFVIFSLSLSMIIQNFINDTLSSGWSFAGIVLLAFSVFNIIWDVIEWFKQISSFQGKNKDLTIAKKKKMLKDDKVYSLEDINSEDIAGWTYENMCLDKEKMDCIVHSRELNKTLWDNDFEIHINENRYKRIKAFLLKNKDIITPFFQYKFYKSKQNEQMFFNEAKLSMASDINPQRIYVTCFKSDYYTSFLTNEISMSYLKRIKDATIIYDSSNFFPLEYNVKNESYYLQPIDKSIMNNHIGISTLAITKDNYLVIRKQGRGTQQNKDSYVPTGSGSADYSDITNDSLIETVQYAMKRELWEENGGKYLKYSIDDIGNTKVIGYFRWLRRGGKPEFTGITKLNLLLDELSPDLVELVDITNKLDTDTFYIESIDDIPLRIEEIKAMEDISVPLNMCLDSLQYFYEERRDELEELLFS